MLRKCLPLAVLLVLSACSSTGGKEYIAPEGPYADQCVSDCSVAETRCRAQVQDQYRYCKREYDWRKRQHDACVNQGGTFCIMPERCEPPRTKVCQDQYDGCFQACGGIIREKEEGEV